MFSIQKFMIDMHPDVDNYVGVVHNIDRNKEVMPHLKLLTWHAATNSLTVVFLIDPTFKMISPERRLIDMEHIDRYGGEESPDNMTVINDYGRDQNPYATLVTTNTLFFHPTEYVMISFS